MPVTMQFQFIAGVICEANRSFGVTRNGHASQIIVVFHNNSNNNNNNSNNNKYKLLCPRGTQTCALAVANIKVNGNGKVILDTHPESDQHQN